MIEFIMGVIIGAMIMQFAFLILLDKMHRRGKVAFTDPEEAHWLKAWRVRRSL